MIHLQPNTGNQFIYVSPFQARKFLASFTRYLLIFTNVATEETFACVMSVAVDNARYTKAGIGTDGASPEDGEVLITESGLYTYEIFGQNSDTNTDPTDATVVGLCEIGPCKVADSAAWTIPSVTIPDNVIYYE